MRRPTEWIYYIAGTLCLVFSIFLLFQSSLSPLNLTNRIIYDRNDRSDRSYREYYQSDLPLHRNNLRQAAVYIPIYSITEIDDISQFIKAFDMEDAQISEREEYFQIQDGKRTLRIYKFLDLLEFEQRPIAPENEPICDSEAKDIARAFAEKHLFLLGAHEIEIGREENKIHLTIIETLGKIPNKAFPTQIVLDNYGNIRTVSHFYFEYEELGRGDIMTAQAAMSSLPRAHSGQARITHYELAYIFSESILQPTYIFHGNYPDGRPFAHHVSAVKYYH
ncbi:MAG: hypothetical protein LBE35_05345 [Clostridiales bacterium]|jgi:hypothetical protein|nr:hypothetical protein [Clostridiales bacterium]